MKRMWLDFTVGLFVIVGVVAFAFLAFRVGSLGGAGVSDGVYRVQADFENLGSVRVGTPVKSAGIVIGEVTTINLNPKNFRGEVVLSIQKRFPFPSDSEVAVMTAGLLGEQYLAVQAGVDSENWADGDKVAYTQSAIVLEKLIGQVMLSMTGKKEQSSQPPQK